MQSKRAKNRQHGPHTRLDATASTVDAVLKMLRRSDCFKGLPIPLLRRVAELGEIREYPTDTELFAVNDPGDYLYGVLHGSLLIYVRAADGRELSLSNTGVGEIGGEIGVIDGGNRTANARTLERTTLAQIPRNSLHPLMLEHPEISLHLLQYLCRRVRQTSAQVEDVAFLSVSQRLAKQLHVLAASNGETLPVNVRISQGDLAAFLNATRQVVNPILQRWQKAGFIRLGRGQIEIFDLEGMFTQVSRSG